MRRIRENLFLKFSLASLLSIAAFALVLALLIARATAAEVLQEAMEDAVSAANSRVMQRLAPGDFQQPMVGARYDAFERFMKQSIVSERTAAVKIWNSSGQVIFSTHRDQVGQIFPISEHLAEALEGDVVGEIEVPDLEENQQEQGLGTLIEVYTPAVFPGSTEAVGAIEVYQYYAPYAALAAAIQWTSWAAIAAGAVLLYAILSLIVHQGWRTILTQQGEIKRRLGEVQALNRQLHEEIDERGRAETALRKSEERYAAAASGANDGLWDWDLLTDEIYLSPRWQEMLGFEAGEIVCHPDSWFALVHPDDVGRLRTQIVAHLVRQKDHFESEYRIRNKQGTYLWMLCRGLAVRGAGGRAYRLAGSQTDITERKRAEEQLLHDAFHDALTGLPNRALFLDRLETALARTKRRAEYLFAVLFLDLDRFKYINDSLGHMIGDELLIALARRLQASLRDGDTIARLGGDEFAILLDDIGDVDESSHVAARIQQELAIPFNPSGHEVFTTASIGIALSLSGYERAEELLRDADTAMYRAKARGRARFEIFDVGMHLHARARLQLENDLRRALERGEFLLHYQPIVALVDGEINGVEALVRWQHPERGLIPPSEFIPVAEETGLIIPLGAWVLHEACRQMRWWEQRSARAGAMMLSVNLSTKQFAQPDLVEQVAGILAETGFDPQRLILEITESAVMEHPAAATTMLMQLRDLGVHLYMDDFGTGYSSLGALGSFPITSLKIDRSFVEQDNGEIVQAIVMLARALGLTVTAEGLETEQQLAELRTLGCDYGQGFLFSKPLSSSDVERWLLKETPRVT